MTPPPSVVELAAGVRRGDRRSLAQAITLVESASDRDLHPKIELLNLMWSQPVSGTVRIGISGTPGVGKSTLIEALGTRLIERGHRLAVLAVDPSSARSRGSILGDKTRMPTLAASPNAFVRPSPAGFGLGGIATSTASSVSVCEAAGYDIVFVETVGVGQSETAVAGVTDLFLLLHSPGGGDELQGIKRGVMELADWVAVTKADGDLLPAAKRAESELNMALQLMRPKPGRTTTPVSLVSALAGSGLEEVVDGLLAMHGQLRESGELAELRRSQAVAQFHSAYEQGLNERTVPNGFDDMESRAPSPLGAAYVALQETVNELNAVTLFVGDMERSVSFYKTLGLELVFGGTDAPFSTMKLGTNFVNLEHKPDATPVQRWGRPILFVHDPDRVHAAALAAGFEPHGVPIDAPWGERFFHIDDPDGHEVSIARPLAQRPDGGSEPS